MPSFEFLTVDVFTDRRFGGNPLAVFPDARGISDGDMQRIAAEFNLSETTFVLPPDDPAHTAKVRIFTPQAELPFAGHPNVGTGYVLADRFVGNAPLLFEERAGLVEIHALRDESAAIVGTRILAPKPLTVGAECPPQQIADCLGLTAADIQLGWHPPQVASVGTDFIVAELTGLEALVRAQPDIAAFRIAAAQPGAPTHFSILIYVRTGNGRDGATPLRMRMFAPAIGVVEDPATGSAGAALAALLASMQGETGERQLFQMEQGAEMGRPSQLDGFAIRHANGSITAGIGGRCVPVMRGSFRL